MSKFWVRSTLEVLISQALILARIYFRDLDDIREIRENKFSWNFRKFAFGEIRENWFLWNFRKISSFTHEN